MVNYSLNVDYKNAPKDKLITALTDSTVNISFKSDGYNILELLLSGKLRSLYVDLKQTPIHAVGNNKYSVFTQNLKEPLANTWGIPKNEISFSKNTLSFNMEALGKKWLKVLPALDLTFKSQHGLYAEKVVPEKIQVFGPEKLIDSLKNIRTTMIKLDKLSANHEVRVKLDNPASHLIRLSVQKVKVYLEIEKYTESALVVPINVTDIHPLIRTFPTTTKLYFNVFLKDYNKVHVNRFKVSPDIRNINLKKVKKLGLKLISKPKEVNNVRMDPHEVEFIIVN